MEGLWDTSRTTYAYAPLQLRAKMMEQDRWEAATAKKGKDPPEYVSGGEKTDEIGRLENRVLVPEGAGML
jgi:hypothetical protein